MKASVSEGVMGRGNLPGGCREADLHRGVSRLDDLSPPQLWAHLDERQRFALYREFFRGEWDELSAVLDAHAEARARDDSAAKLGEAIRSLWRAWRNTAVNRMALRGEITLEEGKEVGQC